jgi:hypothetical protein
MTDRDISPSGDEIYQRLLLQQILTEMRDVRREQISQGKNIARLNVKSGLWGSLGGFIAASVYVAASWLKGEVNG